MHSIDVILTLDKTHYPTYTNNDFHIIPYDMTEDDMLKMSNNIPLLICETDYFGGAGEQSATFVYQGMKKVLPTINDGIDYLIIRYCTIHDISMYGIIQNRLTYNENKKVNYDWFDYVGLGNFRSNSKLDILINGDPKKSQREIELEALAKNLLSLTKENWILYKELFVSKTYDRKELYRREYHNDVDNIYLKVTYTEWVSEHGVRRRNVVYVTELEKVVTTEYKVKYD